MCYNITDLKSFGEIMYPDYQVDVKVCAYCAESMRKAKPVFDSMI